MARQTAASSAVTVSGLTTGKVYDVTVKPAVMHAQDAGDSPDRPEQADGSIGIDKTCGVPNISRAVRMAGAR